MALALIADASGLYVANAGSASISLVDIETRRSERRWPSGATLLPGPRPPLGATAGHPALAPGRRPQTPLTVRVAQ